MFNYSISLVTIATPNFDQLVTFYTQFLGQTPQPLIPNSYAEFLLPGLSLGIFRPQAGQQFPLGRGAISLCLEVENLEQALAHAAQHNNQLLAIEILLASHGREAYIYDPDGNRIILHQGKTL